MKDLAQAPLAEQTKDAYGQHVTAYAAWLGGRREGADVLTEPPARDFAARDFKRYLKAQRGWKPSAGRRTVSASNVREHWSTMSLGS